MNKTTHTPHWHRGLHAVHFAFVSGLIAVTFLGSLGLSVLSPLWIKQADAAVSSFSANSFWNTQVPSYTGLHPDSAALVADVVRQASQYGASVVRDGAAAPVYVADAGASTAQVVPYDCGSGIPPGLAAQWQAVPVPFFAVPSSGAAATMVVFQPSSGSVWEFGHMRNISGQWQACTGGKTSTASDGVFASPYGISTSGLAALSGQLGLQEIKANEINHAIGLNLLQSSGLVWPATQAGGGVAGTPPMGMRFRLDPSVNISSLGLNSVGQAIARAAQTYGFVVWNSAGTVGVTAENPISLTTRGLPDPYASLGNPLANFPWDRLQALPADYGQSVDAPAITQFTVSQSTVKPDTRVTLSWQATSVNRCTIPTVADNLPASGSTLTLPLKTSNIFVLRCGGPGGIASSQVSVTVSGTVTNDPPPVLPPAVTIEQPYSGYANILPELMSGEATEQVYKVVYYEQESYLYETAKPPFALNTSQLDNGKHTIDARVYYRDGRTEQKSAAITVNNSPEILFATTQSSLIKAPESIPPAIGIPALLLIMAFMSAGSWWGWKKSHLA